MDGDKKHKGLVIVDVIQEGLSVCNLCKVELPNESAMRQHLLGKKHKKLDSAENERRRVEMKCGIFIKGYPPDITQDVIMNYFSKFGKIVWVRFGHAFVLMDYEEPSSAEEILKRIHYLGGARLIIKYRYLGHQVQAEKPKAEEWNGFIGSLRDIATFEDQIQMLCQNLQPSVHVQFPKYRKICDDLYDILSAAFPQCRVHPFGSTITGLHFNESDVDVYISGIKRDECDVPYLRRTQQLLNRSRRFSNVFVIPKAKIPILKCVHLETRISCDLNLRNMLGVCNSHLIGYYLNVDPKVRHLMLTLKYWARVHKITGQNYLFSNYSLIMMVLFFLQQEPYRLPSVFCLQQNPRFSFCQHGWNGGFEPLPVDSRAIKSTPLLALLRDFFTFYLDFSYGIDAICPYLGRPLRKEDFRCPETLPDAFSYYKRHVESEPPLEVDRSVCLQDPFEHSRNTTAFVSPSTLNVFVGFCRLGKATCSTADNEGVLYRLVTEVPVDQKCATVLTSDLGQFVIPMQPGLKRIEEKHHTVPERQGAWFESVRGFTRIVLRDILRLEVAELDSSASRNKIRRNEGQSDVCGERETDSVCYACNGKLNLWDARKSTAKGGASEKTPDANGIIEKEIALTTKMCKLYKVVPQMDVIDFKITLEHHSEPPRASVKLEKTGGYKNSFKSFSRFLSAKLPLWFRTYENEEEHVAQGGAN
ncbi:hypothetical protein NQ318_003034 [Aromia moschata]|uniref:RRM domain-containing protein n=1 Tax=Aromia moschata TaxID=1265417 RepID=A0AAV8YPJ2_9CUCU|nr:hypothetical protein NQ318_003034 [Aromia moschata]